MYYNTADDNMVSATANIFQHREQMTIKTLHVQLTAQSLDRWLTTKLNINQSTNKKKFDSSVYKCMSLQWK